MASRLFDAFCRMIDRLPARAVLRAAQAERRMLADDLQKQRTSPSDEALSILTFCDFLAAAKKGQSPLFPPGFPVEHYAFYRRIVRKLVDGGELPEGTQERFDLTFSSELFRALTASA